MEVPTSNIGIRKYNGHWQDYIDRELNSMDHLIQNSFAEFKKEVHENNKKGSSSFSATAPRIRRASEDDGALFPSGPAGIKVPVPNVFTLPRRLTSAQKAVPQEPFIPKFSGEALRESTYVPPGIKELESLYAPMKNLNLPLLKKTEPIGDMPKLHPLPFSQPSEDERDELETLCSAMEDIPPMPPPVQSHALLREGFGHDFNPRRLLGDWGSKTIRASIHGPPAPPKRTNSKLSLRRPAYLNLSRDSTANRSTTFPKPNHHRTSLMSTGSSESSGSSSLTSSCDQTRVVTPTSSKDESFFFRAVTSSPHGDYEAIHPSRLDTTIDTIKTAVEEDDYIKMQPVFTSRDNFHRQTHYINLLYNAVSGGSLEHPQYMSMMNGGRRSGSEEVVSHVYEEPEKCKTDSALRARKKRAKAMAEYRELMAEVECKRLYRIGLNLFNQFPMSGIEYLSQSFLDQSPSSVAKFLHDCSGLSKHKVGEYITELDNPFCMKVLSCFMDLFDFSKLRVDKGVRKVLELVHIPGDASRIRKILEVFSKRYIKCNPKFCAEDPAPSDAVIAFSYAVLLLMTDAADAQKKKKMSLSDFTDRLSRFMIDPKLVKSVYKAVKKDEFKDGGDHFYQTLVLQEKILEPNSRKTARIASHSRRLVCICEMYEVNDIMAKKDPDLSSRKRDIFLFNDLLIVTRQSSKFGKKTSLIYKDSFPLVGLELSLFHTSVYGFGVQICRKDESESVLLTLNADSEMDRYKFVMDLQESILEANQTEEAKRKINRV
uniref:Guanylnucleotide exchange factorlike [Tribolium castaneum] n=1 Tax=Lepeophtheirus salmonis TaxID=72036 RepID=A0A0K2T275_LEPSM